MTLAGSPPPTLPIAGAIDHIKAATVTIRRGRGHGSGFLISPDGYLLTNQHVVEGAPSVLVIFQNGMEVMGDVVPVDRVRDIALVKVPLRNVRPLAIGSSDSVKELATVYAVGTPLKEKLQTTMTKGVISAWRWDRGVKLIQSDVSITSGNSGGPLLDEQGNVIGIAVAGFPAAPGINLFIPVAEALEALKIQVVAR